MKLKRIIVALTIIIALALGVVIGISFERHCKARAENNTQAETSGGNSSAVAKIHAVKNEDGLYLVNRDVNDGKPLFGPAKEIYIEHQNACARVKCNDDTWAIIDCYSGEIMLQGCSKILELPLVTVVGAAICDGKVVIFSLPPGDPFSIIYESPDYTDVEKVIMNDYVIVKKNDKYGVLSPYNGEAAISAEYKYIECIGSNSDNHTTYFLCWNKFGLPSIQSLP